MRALLVALGGAGGALVRAGIGDGLGPLWGTLLVNVVGASVMGYLIIALTREWMRPLILTGFLGGFTTVSALAVETSVLAADSALSAALYFALTVALGVVGLAAGVRLARLRSGGVS